MRNIAGGFGWFLVFAIVLVVGVNHFLLSEDKVFPILFSLLDAFPISLFLIFIWKLRYKTYYNIMRNCLFVISIVLGLIALLLSPRIPGILVTLIPLTAAIYLTTKKRWYPYLMIFFGFWIFLPLLYFWWTWEHGLNTIILLLILTSYAFLLIVLGITRLRREVEWSTKLGKYKEKEIREKIRGDAFRDYKPNKSHIILNSVLLLVVGIIFFNFLPATDDIMLWFRRIGGFFFFIGFLLTLVDYFTFLVYQPMVRVYGKKIELIYPTKNYPPIEIKKEDISSISRQRFGSFFTITIKLKDWKKYAKKLTDVEYKNKIKRKLIPSILTSVLLRKTGHSIPLRVMLSDKLEDIELRNNHILKLNDEKAGFHISLREILYADDQKIYYVDTYDAKADNLLDDLKSVIE